FHYLLPQFSNLFDSVGSELPQLTKMIVQLIKSLPVIFACFIVIFILLVLYYAAKFRHQSPRTKLTPLLKIPFLNSITKQLMTQRFSLNLSSLLKAGISINVAFHIFEKQTYSLFFQQEATEIKFR